MGHHAVGDGLVPSRFEFRHDAGTGTHKGCPYTVPFSNALHDSGTGGYRDSYRAAARGSERKPPVHSFNILFIT